MTLMENGFRWKDISKWYTINMVLDIPTNTYSILLSEKDTGKTIGEAQNIPFSENVII